MSVEASGINYREFNDKHTNMAHKNRKIGFYINNYYD